MAIVDPTLLAWTKALDNPLLTEVSPLETGEPIPPSGGVDRSDNERVED
jgi:hypothetical protein